MFKTVQFSKYVPSVLDVVVFDGGHDTDDLHVFVVVDNTTSQCLHASVKKKNAYLFLTNLDKVFDKIFSLLQQSNVITKTLGLPKLLRDLSEFVPVSTVLKIVSQPNAVMKSLAEIALEIPRAVLPTTSKEAFANLILKFNHLLTIFQTKITVFADNKLNDLINKQTHVVLQSNLRMISYAVQQNSSRTLKQMMKQLIQYMDEREKALTETPHADYTQVASRVDGGKASNRLSTSRKTKKVKRNRTKSNKRKNKK